MATKVIMPQASDSMEEGTLSRWLKREGDPVAKGEAIAEIETDKSVLEVEAFAEGIFYRALVPEGATVPVREAIAIIADVGEAVDLEALLGHEGPSAPVEALVAPDAVASPAETNQQPSPSSRTKVRATPRAKRLAREHGVDLALVSASGPGGSIQERDVLAHLDA